MDAFLERALAPLGADRPRERSTPIATDDGVSLAATLFEPWWPTGAPPRAVIVNSATAVPRRYYAPFARFLAASGFFVITYDYRGIGDSLRGPVRAERARMRDWGERDFAAVIDWTTRVLGAPSPLVVGHSVGGQIVGLAANNARVGALLFVGAQYGDWRLWPLLGQRARMLALWYGVIPPLTSMLGYLPGGVFGGESLPAGVAREWARWGRRRGYIVGGRDAGRKVGFARVRAPLLAYSFADDDYAPAPAVDALVALYTGARASRRHWSPDALGGRPVGHFGFFRPSARDPLWLEARAFLASATAAPAS